MKELTHGALFNGIAGFPLAARWAGIETTWTVEIDDFCNKVSKKHFPNATQYTDIHDCHNLPYVDIISGGFPCQPFSVAGKQLGNEDDRALWPQMLRIIREIKPAYVIGENVTGIINLALDDVLASLEAEGYTTETFIVPACGVNAPHRRDRVWIIAYANSHDDARKLDTGRNQSKAGRGGAEPDNQVWQTDQRQCIRAEPRHNGNKWVTTHTDQFNCNYSGHGTEYVSQQQASEVFTMPDFRLTESPVCSANDGLSSGLVRNRGKQLKAYGNAIVPQIAYQLFEAIKQLDNSTPNPIQPFKSKGKTDTATAPKHTL